MLLLACLGIQTVKNKILPDLTAVLGPFATNAQLSVSRIETGSSVSVRLSGTQMVAMIGAAGSVSRLMAPPSSLARTIFF
jgi:hypothetical protein